MTKGRDDRGINRRGGVPECGCEDITEVRIDGGAPLSMPIEQPLELSPGRHRVVFDHPEHGRIRHFVELRVGEERWLRDVFGESGKSLE